MVQVAATIMASMALGAQTTVEVEVVATAAAAAAATKVLVEAAILMAAVARVTVVIMTAARLAHNLGNLDQRAQPLECALLSGGLGSGVSCRCV